MPFTQRSQASASPGRGDVTLAGNKPGSYPAVLVFLESKRRDLKAGVAAWGAGFCDNRPRRIKPRREEYWQYLLDDPASRSIPHDFDRVVKPQLLQEMGAVCFDCGRTDG